MPEFVIKSEEGRVSSIFSDQQGALYSASDPIDAVRQNIEGDMGADPAAFAEVLAAQFGQDRVVGAVVDTNSLDVTLVAISAVQTGDGSYQFQYGIEPYPPSVGVPLPA